MIVIALIIISSYNGTGFNGYNQVTTARTISGPSAGTVIRTEVYQPGKSLWDWLQLLISPMVLAVGALLFNLATTRTEQKIALDKQREDLLQTYLDCMSDLLLKEKLRSSAVDAEVRNVARVRTITLLFQLDARRIGYVFAFLREAGLMSNEPDSSIVNFRLANLSKINLSQADLGGNDLGGTDLSEAILINANLSGAWLIEANLSGANLSNAILYRANLREANFYKTNIIGPDGSNHAIVSRADFSGADLSGANLTGAEITQEQLKKAKSLQGAILPDGSKHP